MLVEKEVIAPGTYWYEDQKTGIPRKWVVTADTTRYLHEQGNAMLSHGLTVPVPCEHNFDAHPMTPADKLKANAGWVKEYRLRDDKLFATVDIQDEELARKLPKTIRWTSPWISSFTDGSGRAWNNVVAHLALTTRPRVTKQAPFSGIAAAMAFALNAQTTTLDPVKPVARDGFTVSRVNRLVEKGKRLRPQYPMAFSLMSGIALADDDMPPMAKKKAAKGAPPAEGGEEPPEMGDDVPGAGDDGVPDATTPGTEPDMMSDFADQNGDVGMEELLADLLGALGIHLEGNVGEAQFKRALYNAAMTKIHELTGKAQGQPGAGDTNNQPNSGQPNNTPPNPLIHQEQQPMYMSLEEINKVEDPTMRSIALAMYGENAKLRTEMEADKKVVASLRDAELRKADKARQTRVAYLSRASPRVKADLDAMLALPAMALSMGDGGQVVDPMAQTLAVLEKGLADMPRLLTTPSDQVYAQPQPTDEGMLSQEKVDSIADSMARMMGAAPEQKKAS